MQGVGEGLRVSHGRQQWQNTTAEKIKIYNRESQHNAENPSAKGAMTMNKQLTMVYWKGERFWLGKLLEHPDIMTQGETLEELEDNLKDAYRLLVMDDVPDDHHTKAITL